MSRWESIMEWAHRADLVTKILVALFFLLVTPFIMYHHFGWLGIAVHVYISCYFYARKDNK